jgi:DNA invertase Pin-like site-specific DNA recombinase
VIGGEPRPTTKPLGKDVVMNRYSSERSVHGTSVAPSVRCASYARFSSDMQRDESIADQRRKCAEKAAVNGHAITPDLEFSDEAVSGTKRDRDGLNAMLAAAREGKFTVLYFHSLSRLSRESVITLPLLKDLVYNCNVRVISVTEGIDSSVNGWEMNAHLMSIVHEHYLKDLAANVLRGQEGAVLAGFAVGDHCFGYCTEAVAGSERNRRGRNAKVRKLYAVDSEAAVWVRRIFHWFVAERQSLRWIARELNRLQAPKDHRATTKGWHHTYVTRLLKNRKYVGWWPWGQRRNVRDPLTGKVRQVDRLPEETESWQRYIPNLQLVDQETFDAAQQLLAENQAAIRGARNKRGRLVGSRRGQADRHPRHLLAGLVRCAACGRSLSVGGSKGKYLFCPNYATGGCTCKTQLRRERAERMILDAIGQRILANAAWRRSVFIESQRAWHATEAHLPAELAAVHKTLAEVDRKIAHLVDRAEEGEIAPELNQRLAQRRAERQELAAQLGQLQRANEERRPAPTEAWVDERVKQLGDLLRQGTPAAAHALRELVGGEVVVEEVRQPGSARHYLRGRFRVATLRVVQGLTGGDAGTTDTAPVPAGTTEEIVIDFREPLAIEALSVQAKQLYDEGRMHAQIAEELGCARSRVTAVLRFWFQSRGLTMPDGRSRRGGLQQQHAKPPQYQMIADEVMVLWRQEMLLQEIAERCNVDRNTVTAAVEWWHKTHGLPVPDGRTRRKNLAVKCSARHNGRESPPSLSTNKASA